MASAVKIKDYPNIKGPVLKIAPAAGIATRNLSSFEKYSSAQRPTTSSDHKNAYCDFSTLQQTPQVDSRNNAFNIRPVSREFNTLQQRA